MPVKSEIRVEPDHVHILCTGTCKSGAELSDAFRMVIEAAWTTQRAKVLIDANGVSGRLSTMDRFNGAAFLADRVMQGPFRLAAIAVMGREPLIDPERFGETVARNRLLNARVFSDPDEAMHWLRNEAAR